MISKKDKTIVIMIKKILTNLIIGLFVVSKSRIRKGKSIVSSAPIQVRKNVVKNKNIPINKFSNQKMSNFC